MLFSDLHKASLDTATLECWQRERTVSLREAEVILHLIGVDRSFQAIFQWAHRLADSVSNPPSAQPSRVAVDETAVKINGEWSGLYAAIDIDTKLLLDVQLFERPGTDPAAEFLHGIVEKYDCEDTVFLVNQLSYRTALSRLRLSLG